jgi:signal transduction histidine kinase
LASPYLHYGNELRLVAAASRRLVEKLVALDTPANSLAAVLSANSLDLGKRPVQSAGEPRFRQSQRWDLLPALPIDNLAAELMANRNLLAALAGPTIALTVEIEQSAQPVKLNGEDLTRVLVNLVKNAAEAMPGGGKIQLRLAERSNGAPGSLSLSVDDNGPGISPKSLENIFAAGFSTQAATHRGLGLSISRSIIEAAGGQIHAENRVPTGARFAIELPVRTP